MTHRVGSMTPPKELVATAGGEETQRTEALRHKAVAMRCCLEIDVQWTSDIPAAGGGREAQSGCARALLGAAISY
jgi:hypothetical protein